MRNKNTKIQFLKISSLSLLITLAVLLFIVLSNPLRRSEENIKNRLLSKTPLGTQFSEVKKYIKKQGWEIDTFEDENRGFLDQREHELKVVGEKSIRASLGDYHDIQMGYKANVTVFWGFDKDSRLIDIWVWKTWDAP
ncbi:MAG: hypothetical protein ABFD79_12105 [Phycisphaerales bacterium]